MMETVALLLTLIKHNNNNSRKKNEAETIKNLFATQASKFFCYY